MGIVEVEKSAYWAKENEKRPDVETKSLNDQLRELNTLNLNDIQWTIEGNRVIPKSFNVAKFGRSGLTKTLSFKRVRLVTHDAPFVREFAIYTWKATATVSLLEQLASRLSALSNEVKHQKLRLEAAQASTNVSINAVRSCLEQETTRFSLQNMFVLKP